MQTPHTSSSGPPPSQLPEPSTTGPTSTSRRTVGSALGVSKHYETGKKVVKALDNVSASFVEGQFTAIMGPSGSGKSTFMHCLAGLDRPTSGVIKIGEAELNHLSEKQLAELRRTNVGFIFQAYNLVSTLNAEENIELPLRLAGATADRAWKKRVIDAVGLGDRLQHLPKEMSGGQQQRVAVARALLSQPDIIFADEPTGNCDSITSAEILAFMRHAVKELQQTIVMVTHDITAATYADRVLFLADGQIVAILDAPTPDSILDYLRANHNTVAGRNNP